MQLWDVGYGHVPTRHNPADPRMSLWTPGGDHPVGPPGGEPPPTLSADEAAQLDEMQAEMEQVRRELLGAPASVVIANHAMGIYELAAIHLTAQPPQLAEAGLAIDADLDVTQIRLETVEVDVDAEPGCVGRPDFA